MSHLKTLSLAICMALAAPAYASNDDHENDHDSSYENGHDNNQSQGDSNYDSYHVSGVSSSVDKLKGGLSGADEPGAKGEVSLKRKATNTEFEAEVKIPVPSAALAVANSTDAEDASLTLFLTDSLGSDYAECDFDFINIKQKKGTYFAKYKIAIKEQKGSLKERYGVCDVDLATPGLQSGVPNLQAGDIARVIIDTNNAVVVQGSF